MHVCKDKSPTYINRGRGGVTKKTRPKTSRLVNSDILAILQAEMDEMRARMI